MRKPGKSSANIPNFYASHNKQNTLRTVRGGNILLGSSQDPGNASSRRDLPERDRISDREEIVDLRENLNLEKKD